MAMPEAIDPEMREIAADFIRRKPTGRAVAALRAILESGSVTTEDLLAIGYRHPPRAIGDLKDNGIPILKTMVRISGRRMARYTLGDATQIRSGQIGRTNFSKKFRKSLFNRYGDIDEITKAHHQPRSLQIDHRIPYRVGGDLGLAEGDVEAYMLLDAKSQRAKSWSCEQCLNFKELHDPEVCRTCFWAYPDSYTHVAMENVRRADIVWQGVEVTDYDALLERAEAEGTDLSELLKRLGREAVGRIG
jgi:hypothetical protein